MTPIKTKKEKRIAQLKTSLAISVFTALLVLFGMITKKIVSPTNPKPSIEQPRFK
jgi:hypothetical protein